MATRNTNTVFNDNQGNNTTKSHLSTSIIIKVNNYVVGAVQSLDIQETRPSIKMIDEVGTDGHIDSAPNQSTNISGSCERIRFDNQRIAEAFNRGFVHVSSQRIPFDIEIHDRFADADIGNEIITVLKNVWIKELRYSYKTSDWTIAETMSFEAESIFSVRNNNNIVTGVANGQAGPLLLNQFEREADRGVFRGALDAAGLLNAFITDPTG